MNSLDIKQTVFLSFIFAISFKIFESIFGLTIKFYMKNFPDLAILIIFVAISFFLAVCFGILGYYPKILDIKDKWLIKVFQKISMWSTFAFIFFLIWMIYYSALFQGQINRGLITPVLP